MRKFNDSKIYSEKRNKLAEIAMHEAEQGYKANENKCGPEVEKYLRVYRGLFMKLFPNERDWSDLNQGYDWCCAFVTWCCQKAGFYLPLNPIKNWTLAGVPVWYEWGILPENNFYFQKDSKDFTPVKGDIVIYNDVFDGKDKDHIGIVVEAHKDYLVAAEGNQDNQTKIMKRKIDRHINGYIRLSRFSVNSK